MHVFSSLPRLWLEAAITWHECSAEQCSRPLQRWPWGQVGWHASISPVYRPGLNMHVWQLPPT